MPFSFPARGLYAITPDGLMDYAAPVSAALRGGARAIQYRNTVADAAKKHADVLALLSACHRHAAPLVVESDIALALQAGADGVHVHSLEALAHARAVLGAQAIVGVSCCGDLVTARAAVAAGASYVSFGACYASPTLPMAKTVPSSLFSDSAALTVPRVAIGGVTADNGGALVAAGATVLAAISGVFQQPDVEHAARAYLSCF